MKFDELCEEIDEFLFSNEIQICIKFPRRSLDSEIKCNITDSPIIYFYLFLYVMKKVFKDFLVLKGVNPERKEDIIDGLLEMLKEDILKEEENEF